MTFSVVQVGSDRVRRIVGLLWANDEAGARDIAPVLLGARVSPSFSIERTEEREIPLRINENSSGFRYS